MITMILKVTEKCNSNCAYCDVVNQKPGARHMSPQVLEQVFQRIDEYLQGDPARRLFLVWHGGEPLLVGPEYYRTARDLLRKHCPSTRDRITQCMQSNLTQFDEEYAGVLLELGVEQIGTSYDPHPHIRGPGSPRDSDLYNRQFMRGDALAKKHGLGAGIIYVVTRKSLDRPLDVFHFLANLRPGGGFSMNPVLLYDDRRDDLAITPDEYVDFLGEIFPVWWENRSRYPGVSPFSALTSTIRDGERSLGCAESGHCWRDHMNVDPSGEASHCGRSSDWGLLSYGNVRDRSLAQIMEDPQRDELRRRNEVLSSGECSGCRFWTICHGGCPLDGYPEHGGFMHRSEWGCARKSFIEKYFEPVTGLRFDPHG